jgi:hypothetical protein
MKPLYPLILALVIPFSGCDRAPDTSLVKVSQVPAQGLTESSLDQSFLQSLITTTRSAAQARLDQAYEKNRVPPNQRYSHAQTDGHYEQFGQRQLAVIELSYSANPMRVTQIVGLIDDRQVTISCISPDGTPSDLLGKESECAQVIAREFQLDPVSPP